MQIPAQHTNNLDISLILPWLTVLSAAVTILAWYVKTKLREGLDKGYAKMSAQFVTREHLGYVEGMIKQELERKFELVAAKLEHVAGALRDVKDELRLLRDRREQADTKH